MIKTKWYWMGGLLMAVGAVALTGCTGKTEAALDDCGPGRRIESEESLGWQGGGRGAGSVDGEVAGRGGPRGADTAEALPLEGGRRGAGPEIAADQPSVARGAGRQGAVDDSLPTQQFARGRGSAEAAEHGEVVAAAGRLFERDGEWHLRTDEGDVQLGFGPETFREQVGIPLAEGVRAEVRGYAMDGGELSILTCRIDGETYTFRTEDGIPLWSGRYRSAEVAGDTDALQGGRRGGGGRRGFTG